MGSCSIDVTEAERDADRLDAEIEATRIALARKSPPHFIEYVLRDTKRGKPITLQPYHHAAVRQMFNPSQMRTVFLGHPMSGKTELAIGAALWYVGKSLQAGRNPTVCWVGQTKDKASERAASMAAYIPPASGPEDELQESFAHVFPGVTRGSQWSSQKGYKLAYNGKQILSKDANITAAGLDSGMHGGRVEVLIPDDVQTYDNQRIASRRTEVYTQFIRKVMDRLDIEPRVWFLSNAWWEDSCDAMLVSRHRFVEFILAVSDRLTGELNWPDVWPQSRIDEDMENPLRGEVDRRLWCVRLKPSDRNAFKSAWIQLCYVQGLRLVKTVLEVPPGFRIFTGADLGGFNKKKSSDQSCLFTLMIREDDIRKRRVLDVQTGRWDVHELMDRMVSVHRRFKSQFIVESVGIQIAIAQMAAGRELPVRPFGTNSNKHDPAMGVVSMASEMAMGQWEIPQEEDGTFDPEVEAWIAEMECYDPAAHTGDRLMASWFAKMGCYDSFHGHEVVNLDTVGLSRDDKAPGPAQNGQEAWWGELMDGIGGDGW